MQGVLRNIAKELTSPRCTDMASQGGGQPTATGFLGPCFVRVSIPSGKTGRIDGCYQGAANRRGEPQILKSYIPRGATLSP